MIEFIEGELLTKGINYVVVRVGRIGCRLYVSNITMESLPSVNKEAILYTYLHIREDEFSLFGFSNQEEKEIFTLLLSISGIGPKLALAIVSKMRPSELKRVILLNDTPSLVNIPGVGKKTAERIILELKDKIGKQELTVSASDPSMNSEVSSLREEAVSALLALGYSLTEAQKAVPFSESFEGNVTVEYLIRTALKSLSKY